jgi:arylsulfatase A
MIHFPLFASEQFKGKSKMGLIGDTIEEIDWSVGEIMKAISELKLDENTLVIFTSDNGPAQRTAGKLRGNKGTTFEGGVREPCLMRWTGKIKAGSTCDQIAGNIDVLPTMAKLIGAELPKERIIDGQDISPLMLGESDKPVRDTHLYFNGGGALAAVRVGDWKLFLPVVTPPAAKQAKKKQAAQNESQSAAPKKKLAQLATPALFDLSKDVAESTNVADDHPEIVARLEKVAEERLAEIKANQRPAGHAK